MFRIGCGELIAATLLTASLTALGQPQTQSGTVNPLKLSPHHATISVADMEREAAWYERVLGFQRSKLLGDPNAESVYQMSIPGYGIDLVSQKGSSRHRSAEGALEQGWLHVVFKTPDLDAAYKALMAQGTDAKTVRDAQSAITRITFHDPEGNELEIMRQ